VDASAPLQETAPSRPGRIDQLETEIASLREELAGLRAAFEAFKGQF
jgi:hypothetical protein